MDQIQYQAEEGASNSLATIDLSHFFFAGPSFNWPNVATTLVEWPTPQWTDKKHSANMTDTRDLFWLRYKDVELTFSLDDCTTVCWDHKKWSEGDHPKGLLLITLVVLPKDPFQLLQFLELTSHPEARDIAQFWLSFQNFLGYLD
jgi:hypothetical protein